MKLKTNLIRIWAVLSCALVVSIILFLFGYIFAKGAGAESRLALGTAVVFGMFLNTVLATLYIPNWYEWMQTLEEKFKRK